MQTRRWRWRGRGGKQDDHIVLFGLLSKEAVSTRFGVKKRENNVEEGEAGAEVGVTNAVKGNGVRFLEDDGRATPYIMVYVKAVKRNKDVRENPRKLATVTKWGPANQRAGQVM